MMLNFMEDLAVATLRGSGGMRDDVTFISGPQWQSY